MGVANEVKKKLKKAVGLGPGRPRKGQKMRKTGTDKYGKDKREKTIF